jgi:Flp pilus assembly protein TadD
MKGSALVNQGIQFLSGGNCEDAEMAFKSAMTSEPDKVEPVYDLGVCYEVAGRDAEALELYRKALYMKPADARITAGINRMQARIKGVPNDKAPATPVGGGDDD